MCACIDPGEDGRDRVEPRVVAQRGAGVARTVPLRTRVIGCSGRCAGAPGLLRRLLRRGGACRGFADGHRPGASAAASDHDAGDHDHRRVLVLVEGERGERDRSGRQVVRASVLRTVRSHLLTLGERAQALTGTHETVRSGPDRDALRDAPADEALTTLHEHEPLVVGDVGQQVEQRPAVQRCGGQDLPAHAVPSDPAALSRSSAARISRRRR